MSTDEQAIRQMIALWHSATARGDVETVLGLMDENAVFLVTGQPPMRGRTGFGQGLRGLLKTHRIESTSEIQEAEVSGNLAYVWNHLVVKVVALAGNSTVTRSGNALSILHKQPDGQWRLVRDANMLAPSS
ncbi:YybH family protein [Piscinibacter terrae]|uniref:SgcJ/EcaC family oxidoreductase n=1 Tax=Piscinibacter terrae TaxID=2496871 RepID=A0A3N7HRG0_9BURK|nr:SgcJ/EcaC family oxidoreductase [Albitalea terrae]RQP24858.1 SgcJ/EcaC family oxidoreductase [Albitalea terrae]